MCICVSLSDLRQCVLSGCAAVPPTHLSHRSVCNSLRQTRPSVGYQARARTRTHMIRALAAMLCCGFGLLNADGSAVHRGALRSVAELFNIVTAFWSPINSYSHSRSSMWEVHEPVTVPVNSVVCFFQGNQPQMLTKSCRTPSWLKISKQQKQRIKRTATKKGVKIKAKATPKTCIACLSQ